MVAALQTMTGRTTKSSVLTIFFDFIFFKHVSYISEKYSDFMKMKIFSDLAGYNRNMCQHVYRYVGYGLCGYCGLTTHDPDWDTINAGYAAYREKVGFFFNNNTWWTI